MNQFYFNVYNLLFKKILMDGAVLLNELLRRFLLVNTEGKSCDFVYTLMLFANQKYFVLITLK